MIEQKLVVKYTSNTDKINKMIKSRNVKKKTQKERERIILLTKEIYNYNQQKEDQKIENTILVKK